MMMILTVIIIKIPTNRWNSKNTKLQKLITDVEEITNAMWPSIAQANY